ncbi:hypothetical protein [Shouchella clausii]|uniref:Uncharacterized protein n=1 Tax=Shouchella clausii TaxID=79880 RepID=A0A268NXJ0_SHOCL|nr:hypothetical protein [Shouchella clausii]PAE87790.1 hypothetical protein CHH72_16810 [Shouchella clausii]
MEPFLIISIICSIGVLIFISLGLMALNVTEPYADKARVGAIIGFVIAIVPLLYFLIHNAFNEDNRISLISDHIYEDRELNEKDVISYLFTEYGLTKDEYVLDKQPTGSDDYIYTVKSNEKDYELYVVDGEIIGSKELYDRE